MSKIKITCKKCENVFEVYPYRIKEGVQYCSIGCASSDREPWNKGKTSLALKVINKGRKHTEQTRKNMSLAKIGNKNACGNRNISVWNKGKKLNYKPWSYIDGRSKVYNYRPNTKEYKQLRQKVLIRDNFTCQDCKSNNKKLDVHHKVPFLDGGENTLDNLISLCRKCHVKAEWKIRGIILNDGTK